VTFCVFFVQIIFKLLFCPIAVCFIVVKFYGVLFDNISACDPTLVCASTCQIHVELGTAEFQTNYVRK